MISRKRVGFVIAAAVALLIPTAFAACGGSGDEPDASVSVDDLVRGSNGAVETKADTGPVFWRTVDGFTSVTAGEPYKIVLRVTNGSDEEKLTVRAERAGSDTVEFEAGRVEPVGNEGGGSFYTFNLELPDAGTWTVTALAGEDEASVSVEVAAAGAPITRY